MEFNDNPDVDVDDEATVDTAENLEGNDGEVEAAMLPGDATYIENNQTQRSFENGTTEEVTKTNSIVVNENTIDNSSVTNNSGVVMERPNSQELLKEINEGYISDNNDAEITNEIDATNGVDIAVNVNTRTVDENVQTQEENNQSRISPISRKEINEDQEISQHDDPQKTSKQTSSKIITVTFTHDGVKKDVQVEIVKSMHKKPFLGGFRHKLTHTEYLNASCQTYPKKIISNGIVKYTRDTQTAMNKNQSQQTHNNTSTQMTKPGCYVTDQTDVVKYPGSYTTAEERDRIRLKKVFILQSYWRRWLATRYVNQLRKDRDLRIEWEKVQAEQKAAERAQRLQKEFERRMKPKTKADFDLLYAALERWRREETERINEAHSGPERKAALIGLLEQEAYLIQSIERHRSNADKENTEESVRAFLNKAAAPKFWRAYDGKMTQMNTQHTLRAQELRDLYNSLQMNYLSHDERLDVLLTLKHTVKECDCKLTQELMELIDREADLLTRGIRVKNLDGLRQRISTLFMQFCKTPLFNPEVARLLKVPQDPSKLRKDIYFCPSCNSYLPSTEFLLASNSRIVGRCKKCSQLDNNARLRHDFTKIRCIMQHLRRTEEAFDDDSKTAFLIQDADLRYLIENIWNSQSALSGLDELYDLVLVRWNKHEHWSPWNCVLLTKEEASAHMKLENFVEAYGRIFIGKVHHRHVLARQYFSKLNIVSDGTKKEEKFLTHMLASQKTTSVS